jgi:putative tryptophan/tyrosine transport system substrate-binding protein
VDRRAFLGTLTGGLLAAPRAGGAQTAGKVPVVGILNSAFTGQSTAIAAFRSGLLDAGLIEGQTIALEIRSAGGKPEALAALAAELVQRKVDFICPRASGAEGREGCFRHDPDCGIRPRD